MGLVSSIKEKFRIVYLVLISLACFSGCVSYPKQLNLPIHSQSLLKKDYYSVDIPSFDGNSIRATIFQPALRPHETAPVILHVHGFGMFRMTAPTSLYGSFILSGVAAKKAWENGYWVMSIDHRGHGGSAGKINMMDPEIEVRDLSWVIDWIEANMPRIKYEKGDPVIGMIGESYGGGLQLLGASLDDRIDAIVPITTWYDFSNVLTPNNVVKSGWLTTLVAVGNTINPFTMNRDFNKSYFRTLVGDIPSDFGPMMTSRSLSNTCYCRADAVPHADAFFIQAFRDVLFPINEAVKNLECLEASGRDVRLLGTQNGHLLPFTQFSTGLPGYDVDTEVTCDDETHRTDQLILAWFDEKLKGMTHRADIVPKVCLTHDQSSGSIYEKVPLGGVEFKFKNAKVGSGFSGMLELPLKALDWVASSVVLKSTKNKPELLAADKNDKTGTFRPTFVPLKNIQTSQLIAGIPIANFTLSGDALDIIFASVAVRRNGSLVTEILSEQVYPFRGGADYTIQLPAVSAHLHKGDTLGLVFAGYSNQYRLSSRVSSRARISGSVKLPLHEHE